MRFVYGTVFRKGIETEEKKVKSLLKREDLYQLNYYKRADYYGSVRPNVRFRISLQENQLEVTVWQEPWCYDVAPEEEKERQLFPADEEGFCQAVNWINSKVNVK